MACQCYWCDRPNTNVAAIRAAGPAVLVLSASDRPDAVRDAMRAGARGYVLKNEEAAELRAAVTAVAAGPHWVSPRLAYILATDDAPDRPVRLARKKGVRCGSTPLACQSNR